MKKNEKNMLPAFTTATTNVPLPLNGSCLPKECNYDIIYNPYTLEPREIHDNTFVSYPLYAMNYTANLMEKMIKDIEDGQPSSDANTYVAANINMITEVAKSRLSYLITNASFYTKYFFVDILANIPKIYPHIAKSDAKEYIEDPIIINRFNEMYKSVSSNIDMNFDCCSTYIMNMVVASVPLDATYTPGPVYTQLINSIVIAAYSKLSSQLYKMVSNLLKDTYPLIYNETCAAVSEALQLGQLNMANAIFKFIQEYDEYNNGIFYVKDKHAFENTSVPYPTIYDTLMTFDDVLNAIDSRIDNSDSK